MTQFLIANNRIVDSNICKYFRVNNDFYNSILNNYLWFSDPLKFNDPYDFHLFPDITKNSRDELLDYYSELKETRIEQGDSLAASTDINKKVDEVLLNPERFQISIENYYKKHIIPNFGVCCFSQDEFNLLMWSHYAESHQGICLKFDIEKDLEFFKLPFQVDYPIAYPKVDYLKHRKNKDGINIQTLLATKSIDWKYENEIRIIKDYPAFPIYRDEITFSKECLIEVIFGYKTDKKTIDNLKTLLKGTGYKCDFTQVCVKKNNFGLEKHEI